MCGLIRFCACLFSGLLTAVAGVLFVYYNQFISPQALALTASAEVLLMVISGGAATLLGPIVGAALVVIMKNVASGYIERWNFLLGAIFVAIVIFMPEGLVPGTVRLWRQGCRALRGRRCHRDRKSAEPKPMSALTVNGSSKAFGGLRVTRDVNLSVEPGERRLIIGPNGAGKTTLFNLITGELTPDSGSVSAVRPGAHARCRAAGARTSACHVPTRSSRCSPRDTSLRNVMLSLLGSVEGCAGTACAFRRAARPGRAGPRRARARRPAATSPTRPLSETSYGERRRVEIAMALAQNPKVLLLDEPYAGLSIDERARRAGNCCAPSRATSPS